MADRFNDTELQLLNCEYCNAKLRYGEKEKKYYCDSCGRKYLADDTGKPATSTKLGYKCTVCSGTLMHESENTVKCDSCGAVFYTFKVKKEEKKESEREKNPFDFDINEWFNELDKKIGDIGNDEKEVVIPFSVGEKSAKATFVAWLKKNKLLPNDFWEKAKVTGFKDLYIPVYNCTIGATYYVSYESGKREERQILERKLVHEYVNGEWIDQYANVPTKEVYYEWHPDSKIVSQNYNRCIIGSDELNSYPQLGPVIVVDSAYAGNNKGTGSHEVLKRNIKRNDILSKPIKETFHNEFKKVVENYLYGDSTRNISWTASFDLRKATPILYPLYVFNYEYEDKKFYYLLAGNGSRNTGTAPTDKSKKVSTYIWMYVITIFISLFSCLFLLGWYRVFPLLGIPFMIPGLVTLIRNYSRQKKDYDVTQKMMDKLFENTKKEYRKGGFTNEADLNVADSHSLVSKVNVFLAWLGAFVSIATVVIFSAAFEDAYQPVEAFINMSHFCHMFMI